jgi:hypothetical protein
MGVSLRPPVVAFLACLAVIAVTALIAAEPALAFARPPRGAPAPLLGIGLPLAGGVLALVMLARRYKGKG